MRIALLALAICGACASPSPDEPPAVQGHLARAESRAAALVRSGEVAAAARAYEDALRIATSLDDVDAVAANAINLSIVYQWLGRNADARRALAPLLGKAGPPFAPERRLQAELRRAILELSSGDREAAAVFAARAAARCAGGCPYAPTLLNVQAQIALAGGATAQAAQLAQAALERARGRGDGAETANALRTLARCRRLGGDPAGARALLEQALEVDRALAEPRKIFADLNELAQAAEQAGEADAARDYAARAAAVSRASGDGRSLTEMEAGLRRP